MGGQDSSIYMIKIPPRPIRQKNQSKYRFHIRHPISGSDITMTYGYEDKAKYFVDRLAEGIGMISAAFYPKPVIVRLSDFKTNEYAHLIGGEPYEPKEVRLLQNYQPPWLFAMA